MIQDILHKEGRLGSVILSLCLEGSTGTLRVKEDEAEFTFFFHQGHLAYADGIDKEGPLLAELVSKGRLDLKELDALRVLKEKDPQSLGKTLLARKLVSETLWREFIRRKAKALLSTSFDMEDPDLLFSECELNIPPVNLIADETIPFVMEAVRRTTPHYPLKEILKSKDMVFGLSSDALSHQTRLPLNPSEEKTLSLINGRHTAKELVKASGLTARLFQKSLYCLLRLGIVDTAFQQPAMNPEHSYIIRLYLNLLLIVEAAFRQEIGKRSQKILKQCVTDMALPGRDLFSDLDLVNENTESAARKIGGRFMEQKTLTDERLVLLTSFSKLLFLLITRMKRLLGEKRAMRTIQEMIRALVHFDPGKKHPETMLYVKKNLEDLARQMKS